MRNGIFITVSLALAGVCWLIVQSASPDHWNSPFNRPAKRTAAPAAPNIAELAASQPAFEPTVAPTTELSIPSIPSGSPMPPANNLPSVPLPPVTLPPIPPVNAPAVNPQPGARASDSITVPVQPVGPAASAAPKRPASEVLDIILPGPAAMPNAAPAGPPGVAAPNIIVPQADIPLMLPPPGSPTSIVVPEGPIPGNPVAQSLIPLPPPAPPQPGVLPQPSNPAQSVTQPARKDLPPLPPVPGVQTSPSGIPNYASPAPEIGPMPGVPGATTVGPPPWEPTAGPQSWTTDNDNGYWQGRQLDSILAGPRFWASTDYLLWYIKPATSPSLFAGISPQASNASQAFNLYPTGNINFNPLSGVRGTAGFWLTPNQTIGFDSSYYWFGTASTSASVASNPNALLGRSFVDAANGQPAIFLFSTTDGVNGYGAVTSTLHLEGGDANILFGSLPFFPRLTVLAGFRYFEMNEGIQVWGVGNNPSTGFNVNAYDSFSTRNDFFGGQLGLRWTYQSERFFVNLTGKIAYGANEEHVAINGSTTMFMPGSGTSTVPGGLLALPSNIGSYDRTRMTFLPEGLLNVGYRMTSWATVTLGYTFMYINDVVRPGQQMNTVVNPANLPFSGSGSTGPQPSFTYRNDSLWLQGLNVGVTLSY